MPLTIVLIPLISTLVTELNFGKRYEDNGRVIFDHWAKWHLSLNTLSNQKMLNGLSSSDKNNCVNVPSHRKKAILDTSRILCHPIHHGLQSGNA